MLKMALINCASNKRCCSVDGGRDICPLFSVPTPEDLTAQESPPPRIRRQKQKNANARDQPGRGLGAGGSD